MAVLQQSKLLGLIAKVHLQELHLSVVLRDLVLKLFDRSVCLLEHPLFVKPLQEQDATVTQLHTGHKLNNSMISIYLGS